MTSGVDVAILSSKYCKELKLSYKNRQKSDFDAAVPNLVQNLSWPDSAETKVFKTINCLAPEYL